MMNHSNKNKYSSFLAFSWCLALCLTLLIGCGSKKKSSTPAAAPPASAATCVAGQIWSPTHNACLQACSQTGYGVDPTTQQCVLVQTTTSTDVTNSYRRWWGKLIVTNTTVYQDFLEQFGNICTNSTYYYPTYQCSTWDMRADVFLQSYGTSLGSNGGGIIVPYSDLGYAYPGNDIFINGTFSPVNDNTGFELVSNSGFYSNVFASISSNPEETILLTDNQLHIYFWYQGKQFGKAQVTSY